MTFKCPKLTKSDMHIVSGKNGKVVSLKISMFIRGDSNRKIYYQ